MVTYKVHGLGHRVVLVGAGEVFRRCYITGNKALPSNHRFYFSDIIDVIPEDIIRCSMFAQLRALFLFALMGR